MTESPKPPSDAAEKSAGKEPSPGRRRLLRTGLTATPVLATVVARSVLAQNCLTPSAFVSGNVSGAGNPVACTGRTPGYWKTHTASGDWPTSYQPTGGSATQFCASPLPVSFTPKFMCASQVSGQTVLDVLNNGGGPPFDVARHIAAAMLNNAAGLVPTTLLPMTTIVQIWNEYVATSGGTIGYWTIGTTHLDHQQIVDYLLTTMPI